MDTEARLWSGKEELDSVYHKIVNLMECVFTLDGNFCENEVLHIANELQGFTINDMEAIDQLNIDIIDIDDEEYDSL